MDIAEQAQQLRLVHRLEKDAERDLMDTETMQRRRWELLRRVADYAGDSYTAMRIDVVDERLRDQGATHWLGAMLTIGVTLIPVTAMTHAFIAGLTTTTQKLLTSADRKLLQAAETVYERELDPARVMVAARMLVGLQNKMRQTEGRVSHYTEKWLEPELSNKLQEYADALLQARGKPPFGQEELIQRDVLLLQGLESILQGQGKQTIQKDVPVVQIK